MIHLYLKNRPFSPYLNNAGNNLQCSCLLHQTHGRQARFCRPLKTPSTQSFSEVNFSSTAFDSQSERSGHRRSFPIQYFHSVRCTEGWQGGRRRGAGEGLIEIPQKSCYDIATPSRYNCGEGYPSSPPHRTVECAFKGVRHERLTANLNFQFVSFYVLRGVY